MTSLSLNIPQSPSSRTLSYSAFHLPSSPSSDADGAADSSDEDTRLPFPTALARNDFLAPDFHAAAYLSSLFPSDADTTSAHRHQTLEDLRGELRERSSAISAELLELVNANYTSFLELGDELRGGEERAEDLRVALLGFRRALEDIQGRVRARRVQVAEACRDLGQVKGEVELGRQMLELDDRVGLLEDRLAVESLAKGEKEVEEDVFADEESDEGDENDADGGSPGNFVGSSPSKLMGLARDFVFAEQLADGIGTDMPFVRKMGERLERCRNTILLDLNTALKEARTAGEAGQGRILRFLAIYRVLGGQVEAVRVLQEK